MIFDLFKEKVNKVYKKVMKKRLYHAAILFLVLGVVYVFQKLNPNMNLDSHPIFILGVVLLVILMTYCLHNSVNPTDYFDSLNQEFEKELGNYDTLLLHMLSAHILMNDIDSLDSINAYFYCKEKINYNQALLKQYTVENLTNTVKYKLNNNEKILTKQLVTLTQFIKEEELFANTKFNELVLLDLNEKEAKLEQLEKKYWEDIELEKQKSLEIEQSLSLDTRKVNTKKYLAL